MKKILLLLYSFHCSVLVVSAQDPHLVDSLDTHLKKVQATKLELGSKASPLYDTLSANILYALSKAYWGNNPEKAMDYAKQTLAISEPIGYKKGIGNAYLSMGAIYDDKGDFVTALVSYNKSLLQFEEIGYKKGIASSINNIGLIYYEQGNYSAALKNYVTALQIKFDIRDQTGIANSYNNIGQIYAKQGNYTEALKNYFAGLKIREELGNKKAIADSYNSIGSIFSQEGNYTEALKNYFASLKLKEETGDKQGIAYTRSNIGIIYNLQGNSSGALKEYLAALSITEELGDKGGIAYSYSNIGNTYYILGDYPEALKKYTAALTILEEMGDKTGVAMSCNNIGKINIQQRKYREASQNLQKALALSKEIDGLEVIKLSYQNMAALDSAQGHYSEAFRHYKLFITARDSLSNNEKIRSTVEMQMRYNFDKKQVADSLTFAQEKEVSALLLQRQKAITYTGFAGVLAALLILYLVYRNYQKQRLANLQLKAAQNQLIKSEKMAAFGVMASRVSHEILNPLNFVNNFSELSQGIVLDLIESKNEEDKKENADLLMTNLQKINEHGQRASGIVKQLQERSSKGSAHEFFE